jgi:DNA-binding response OmpR family regulator
MIDKSPIPEMRIMVVEDDTATRLLLKKVISNEGYNVDESSSAEFALALMSQNKYHVIITDISMPGKDGLELLAEVKKRDPMTQVVMLTGEVTMSRTLQALELGATDFLLKPVEVEELLMIIRMCEAKILRWWGVMRAAFGKKKAGGGNG